MHRSSEMCLAQLFIQNESAYQCVAELGELGVVQFKDLNSELSSTQRRYVKEIKRFDEMERKLRYFEAEIKKDSISMSDADEMEIPQAREMFEMDATFEKLENELREVNQNEEMLKENFTELTEFKYILDKAEKFFEQVQNKGSKHQNADLVNSILRFVTGVIQRERLPAFERLLWRACQGNAILLQSEITESLIDTKTGASVCKNAFIIFFQGEQLKSRVKKICECFHATFYPCPDTPQERQEMSTNVMTRIEDLKAVLGQTQDHKHRVLVATAKNVRMWIAKTAKVKATYHTLNMFSFNKTQKCLIAECWCPIDDLDSITEALEQGSRKSGNSVSPILSRVETSETPPTLFRTNKFTRGFQNIVDSYGIASYRELNPALYTIISFPFLFALMFGDFGHGIIMFLAALFFILKEKQLESAHIKDEIFQTFFGGRYVIALMGLFSIYTGFIYNDFFGKSFNLFGSSFLSTFSKGALQQIMKNNSAQSIMLDPERQVLSVPYPVGLDPIWCLAEENRLSFLNSMKMKSSIIIGIAQMTFGVVLSLQNFIYFKSRLDIFFTFIPQIIFLGSIFIYLCLEIILKWILFSVKPGTIFGYKYPGSNCAPSLLIGLINMVMMKNRDEGFVKNGEQLLMCHLNYWYPGQRIVEIVLLILSVLMIPIMLFAKPFFLWRANKRAGGSSKPIQEQAKNDQLLDKEAKNDQLLDKDSKEAKDDQLLEKDNKEAKNDQLLKKDNKRTKNDQLLGKDNKKDKNLRPDKSNQSKSKVSIQEQAKNDQILEKDNKEGKNLKPDKNQQNAKAKESQPKPAEQNHEHDNKSFNFGDIMVYQAIHTIEFVLGCISHTASYLRLWALSLAHAQLSEVLWHMILRKGFGFHGYTYAPFLLYPIFLAFALLTLSILVLMEGLSAFLHALRLHWVEFQSKFYKGDGYPFVPFSFEKVLDKLQEDE